MDEVNARMKKGLARFIGNSHSRFSRELLHDHQTRILTDCGVFECELLPYLCTSNMPPGSCTWLSFDMRHGI